MDPTAGDETSYPATISVPTDNDAKNAASVGVPLTELADRTAAIAATLPDVHIFEANASVIVPDGTQAFRILAVGSGGAGGDATTNKGGGGGSSGAFVDVTVWDPAFAGLTLDVVVGAPGASSVARAGEYLAYARAGVAGATGSGTQAGGALPTPSTGGASGAAGVSFYQSAGGGGGGNAAQGGDGGSLMGGAGSAGGLSATRPALADGAGGSGYGAGGGGGGNGSGGGGGGGSGFPGRGTSLPAHPGAGGTGGAGASGVVYIIFYKGLPS